MQTWWLTDLILGAGGQRGQSVHSVRVGSGARTFPSLCSDGGATQAQGLQVSLSDQSVVAPGSPAHLKPTSPTAWFLGDSPTERTDLQREARVLRRVPSA